MTGGRSPRSTDPTVARRARILADLRVGAAARVPEGWLIAAAELLAVGRNSTTRVEQNRTMLDDAKIVLGRLLAAPRTRAGDFFERCDSAYLASRSKTPKGDTLDHAVTGYRKSLLALIFFRGSLERVRSPAEIRDIRLQMVEGLRRIASQMRTVAGSAWQAPQIGAMADAEEQLANDPAADPYPWAPQAGRGTAPQLMMSRALCAEFERFTGSPHCSLVESAIVAAGFPEPGDVANDWRRAKKLGKR
jgi:hypothetical protein